MDLTSIFFVLCINMKVYLYNYSKWEEPSMNIHEGKVKQSLTNLSAGNLQEVKLSVAKDD